MSKTRYSQVMPSVWRDRMIYAAPFVAVVGMLAVAPSDDGPTVCPIALCTGNACPGCGMTRALSWLVRGDLGAAFTYHPLVPLIALQLVGGWIWFVLRRTGRVPPMTPRTLNAVLIVTGVALLAVWLTRLALGTLPPV